jgi:hypothetical protein
MPVCTTTRSSECVRVVPASTLLMTCAAHLRAARLRPDEGVDAMPKGIRKVPPAVCPWPRAILHLWRWLLQRSIGRRSVDHGRACTRSGHQRGGTRELHGALYRQHLWRHVQSWRRGRLAMSRRAERIDAATAKQGAEPADPDDAARCDGDRARLWRAAGRQRSATQPLRHVARLSANTFHDHDLLPTRTPSQCIQQPPCPLVQSTPTDLFTSVHTLPIPVGSVPSPSSTHIQQLPVLGPV